MSTGTFEAIATARQSCRAFLPDPVAPELIEKMFQIAQTSPSWCNSQAWQVILTSGAGTEQFRTELYDYAMANEKISDFDQPLEYHGVYQERRREAGFGLYSSLGIAKDDYAARTVQMLENFRFFGAPHVAIISSDRALGSYGAVDCGGYVATLLLAAESLGIGAVPQAAIAMQSDFIHSYFDLPQDRMVVCAVSFGYADAQHPANGYRTARAEFSEVVQHFG